MTSPSESTGPGPLWRGLLVMRKRPGLVLPLAVAQALASGIAWLALHAVLDDAIAGRPAPTLFRWLTLLAENDALRRTLVVLAASAVAVYLVLGSLASAMVLARLRQPDQAPGPHHSSTDPAPAPSVVRLALRLLVQRLLGWGAAVLMLGAATLVMPAVVESAASLDDERLLMAGVLIPFLPWLVPCVFIGILVSLAGPPCAQGAGPMQGLAVAFRLAHRRAGPVLRTTGSLGALWLLATLASGIGALHLAAVAQAGVLVRLILHFWLLCSVWEIWRAEPPDRALGPTG